MIRSMTGYGFGECFRYNRIFTVEIKAVNHRFCDISVRMPRVLSSLEERVRSRAQRVLVRGKTDIFVTYESFADDDCVVTLNEQLADAYAAVFKQIKGRYADIRDDLSLSMIANMPSVITVDKNTGGDSEEVWEALSIALEMALAGFVQMREREGLALRRDIMQKAETLSALSEIITERAPKVSEDHAERLRQKVAEALQQAEIDEARLLQEITQFADKSCIDEELTRLSSHLIQLKNTLADGGTVGKKLDFLIQEINREINTIGAKSNDLEITKAVVDLKSELEKIREQVQNIE